MAKINTGRGLSDPLRQTTHTPVNTTTHRHIPADGPLARDDVTFAVIEAEVGPQLADALARQPVDAEVSSGAHALGLASPPVHHTLCILVTRLELTGVGLVAWGGGGEQLW